MVHVTSMASALAFVMQASNAKSPRFLREITLLRSDLCNIESRRSSGELCRRWDCRLENRGKVCTVTWYLLTWLKVDRPASSEIL